MCNSTNKNIEIYREGKEKNFLLNYLVQSATLYGHLRLVRIEHWQRHLCCKMTLCSWYMRFGKHSDHWGTLACSLPFLALGKQQALIPTRQNFLRGFLLCYTWAAIGSTFLNFNQLFTVLNTTTEGNKWITLFRQVHFDPSLACGVWQSDFLCGQWQHRLWHTVHLGFCCCRFVRGLRIA